ncbi:MAG TPA: outer membrane beta-barrel protein [Magnetospirillaceae bacterium]|nr:outer membrane beta-barrel protein [Magnetospirillaceae bacterium]
MFRKLAIPAALAAGVIGLSSTASAAECDPYKDYSCLDSYLGDGVLERLANYYKLEWGHGTAPSDPNAPAARRENWPGTPETTPPMPYAEWPTGALTSIGVSRPNSADSPLMVAIANTSVGQWMADNHLQVYGWVNPGANLSSNSNRPGGNAPIAYAYTPNTAELDQAVIYLERTPDTVQTDHWDWGFRVSAIYGENYRYTNSYGIASYQFNKDNNVNGYDFPMVYGEVYIPNIAEGLVIRAGRYISIPDIEAQLAPNNILYTHSLTYALDNYTNTGVVASLAATPNWLVQLGVADGTETPIWHNSNRITNPFPNPIYPGSTFEKDPGNQPSLVACVRWSSDSGDDTIYPCLDGINNAKWGYNNLQWHGLTYYHKWNDQWHISNEAYYMSEHGVPNLRNAQAVAIFNNGGTPFSPQVMPYNSPNLAYCGNAQELTCNVQAYGFVSYLNYTPDSLNNFTFRPEWYWDPQGWRTGTGANTHYVDFTLGWQHFFSPQLEIRPEISYWQSIGAKAFNSSLVNGIAGNKNATTMFAMDAIIHF